MMKNADCTAVMVARDAVLGDATSDILDIASDYAYSIASAVGVGPGTPGQGTILNLFEIMSAMFPHETHLISEALREYEAAHTAEYIAAQN